MALEKTRDFPRKVSPRTCSRPIPCEERTEGQVQAKDRLRKPWVGAEGRRKGRRREGERNLGDGEAPGHDGGEPATRGDPGGKR